MQENGHQITPSDLQTGFVPDDTFSAAHHTMCFACHDVLVCVDGKYLLVNRDNAPAKDILRGVSTEESLRTKVRKEAGLELTNIRFLGVARTLFETDPWGHGRGTDTLNLMYVADGEGGVHLDRLHSEPRWISEEEFQVLRESLHPYVAELFDKALA